MFVRATLAALFLLCLSPAAAEAKRLHFQGLDFTIKEGRGLGPGPNDWAKSQAFVDTRGRLHLRFSEKDGKWYAGEVQSVSRFGFGTYEMVFEGDIGGQDPNVVFGFFNYPPADVGPDATNEIDIEFARWGNPGWRPLNYTVWPVKPGIGNAHQTFGFRRGVTRSVHRFIWTPKSVAYQSAVIRDDDTIGDLKQWTFRPSDPARRISRQPMPVYFNLWGFRGQAPRDGDPVEVIVESFKFTPMK